MPRITLTLAALALSLVVAGCSGGGGEVSADNSKSTADLQTEAEGLDKTQIQAKIDEYTAAIADKQKDVDAIVEKIKNFDPTELLGEKAKELKLDQESLGQELAKLQERLKVYVDELAKRN